MIKDFDEEYKANLLHAEELEYAGDYKAAGELYSHLATVAKMKKEPQWNLILALLTHSNYCFQKSNQLDRVSKCSQRIEKVKQEEDIDNDFHIGQTLYNFSHYELIRGFDKDFVEKSDMELKGLLQNLLAMAQEAEKKKTYRIAAARYARIVELYKRIKPLNYEEIAVNLEKAGHHLSKSKCYKQALFFYEESVKINSRIEDRQTHIAVNYNNMSFIYLQHQDYDQALHYCEKSLELHRKLKDQYQIAINVSNLGQIYFKKQLHDDALKNFQEAIELKTRLGKREDIAQEMYNIGVVYYTLEKYKPAIARIENAINIVSQLKRKDDIARYSATLGELYQKFGQKELAIKYMEKSFSMYYIINKKSRAGEVIQDLAQLHLKDSDYKKAITCIRQNIGIQEHLGKTESVISLLKEVASIYYDLDNLGEAIGYYQKAADLLGETETYFHDMQVLCLWSRKGKQYKKANEYLQKALIAAEKHPHLPQDEIYHLLAMNFYDLNNYESATEFYEHAIHNTTSWFKKSIHLEGLAKVCEVTQEFKEAIKLRQEIISFCHKNRRTDNILLMGAIKWQKSSYKHQEFKNYYFEAVTIASLAKLYQKEKLYQKSLNHYLLSINLFRDIIAIDIKDSLEAACNKDIKKLPIQFSISKQKTFLSLIQQIKETFEIIIQEKTGKTKAIIAMIDSLFDAKDSVYGIEFCDQLLSIGEKYIKKSRFAYYLSQMGLRYRQIKEYKKSILHYAKSAKYYIDMSEGQQLLVSLEKLNATWESFENESYTGLGDIDLEQESYSYIENCIEIAYDIADEHIYIALVQKLWFHYKESNDVVKMEEYLEKASSLSEKIKNITMLIDVLEMLSECYNILGKEDEVIATQQKICSLQESQQSTISSQNKDFQKNITESQEQESQEQESQEQESQEQESQEQESQEQESQEDDEDIYIPLSDDVYSSKPTKDISASPPKVHPETLNKMGETFISLRRYEDALLNLNALLSLYAEEKDFEKISKTLVRISGIHQNQDLLDKAQDTLYEAWDVAKKLDERDIIESIFIKFNEVCKKMGDIKSGIDFYKKIMRDEPYRSKWMDISTYFISDLYQNNNDIEDAISNYEISLNLQQEIPNTPYISQIDILQKLIDLNKKRDHYEKVILYYEELVKICKKNKLQDTLEACQHDLHNICWMYYQDFLSSKTKDQIKPNNLYCVLLYLAQNSMLAGFTEDITHEETVSNLREANNFYKDIEKYCNSYASKIEKDQQKCLVTLAQSLSALGDYHMNFQEYTGAIDYYLEEIEIIKFLEDSKSLIQSFIKLAEAYENNNQCEKAIETLLQITQGLSGFYSVEEEMQIYNQISSMYVTLENFEKSQIYCQKILDIGKGKEEQNQILFDTIKKRQEALLLKK